MYFAPLAQLVEQWPFKPTVGGSIPSRGTLIIPVIILILLIPYIKISKYQNMGGLVLMDWFECIRVVDKFLKLLTVEVFCAKVGLLSKGLKEVLVLILKYGKI